MCRSDSGGPHAAYFATRDEYKASHARPSCRRLHAMPTVAPLIASHCKRASNTSGRDKATSNICTAQVLLAGHGIDMRRLSRTARPSSRSPKRVHSLNAVNSRRDLRQLGLKIDARHFSTPSAFELARQCRAREILTRAQSDPAATCAVLGPHSVRHLHWTRPRRTTDLEFLLAALRGANVRDFEDDELRRNGHSSIPQSAVRSFAIS